ncbi:MAG TPA: glycine zipper 2TM domain-containing protein [Sphingomonadaceae bacterium]|nr:glycine zipper 2TM domain-containing protein [Sphingomonadaceae bacterium]
MFARTVALSAVAALAAVTMSVSPADARPRYSHGYSGHYGGPAYGHRGYYNGRGYYGHRGYYGRGYYRGRCRDSGTGGTIIGAIAGGLLGNEIGNGRYGRGDGTTGAILGAGVGALAGRAIDRDC